MTYLEGQWIHPPRNFHRLIKKRKKKYEHGDDDWTDLSNKNLLPYEISKTKSEKKMWEIAGKSDISACAINPVLVLGPSLTGVLSMSNRLTIKKLFNLPFVPDMAISVVGVMDVADAHVRAMESKISNGKRFLLSEKTIKLVELTQILKNAGFNKVKRPPKHRQMP